MTSSLTSICFLIYAAFASAKITSLSPDQLAQLTHDQSISKNQKPITNPLALRPDENNYVPDTVSLSKREAGLNSISVVDLVKNSTTLKPSKKTIRSTKLKPGAARDLILEVVKKMIEKEKARTRFDVVNPKNSRYTKKEQLLWDRLRIKATEEVLLHPKPTFPKVPEKLFNSFKMDQEDEGPEVTEEPGLFSDFKKRVEKEYYNDKIAKGRLYISTLKPVY